MRTIYLSIIWFLTSYSITAQTIEYFDADWNRLGSKESGAYYREITYDVNGKPVGKVREHYITGELQFEGQLLSINPDTLDAKCVWYHRNGQKNREVTYQNGNAVSTTRIWSEEGKEEGVLDTIGV